MSREEIFLLPNVNDPVALEAHKLTVLREFDDVFRLIDAALRDALPKSLNIFKLLDGKVDLSVHAPNTRYIVKQFLSKKNTPAEDEEELRFDLLRVSNCGLCIQTDFGAVRVLKATPNGLPKAHSDARVRFSCSNQMILEFAPATTQERVPALNLFVLWTMDREYKHTGMEVACPRTAERQGEIDCFWLAPWSPETQVEASAPNPVDSNDLEEIQPIPAKDKSAKKA